MYKVMLIDDDVPMLDYLAQLIDWRRLGTAIAASTHSAELALERFRDVDPDIVMTDIGLPAIDGMELARTFRARKPDVRIIFLTCYEDVDYLKQAFRLEADDYLIKDELTADKLADSIRKSVRWLKGREESLERLSFREDLQRNRDVLKTSFFESVVKHGRTDRDTMLFGERLAIRWPHDRFSLVWFHLDAGSLAGKYAWDDAELLLYAAYNVIEEVSATFGFDAFGVATPFLLREEGVCVIVNVDAGTAGGKLRETIGSFAADAGAHVERVLKVNVSAFYVAESVEAAKLRHMYRTIRERMRDAYYEPYAPAYTLGGHSAAYAGPEEAGPFAAESGVAMQAFEELNAQLIDVAMNQFRTKAARSRPEPSAVIGWCDRLVRSAAASFRLPANESYFGLLHASVRLEETERLTRAHLKRLLRAASATGDPMPDDPALAAIHAYIDDHICETVTSVDVAGHLHLNPSYFSRFFKKKTGLNFTEYAHQYKMRLAKRLLKRPDETVESVAYTLGYSDRAYFSKVFKRYVGVNPGDYKQGDAEVTD
ncbi:response regulator [Paenibacillus antri]|uniref:Response regulator n=1 Tax=Paenibacillus antri TaxID=2582848 RepID=A0A5R9G643_9BACL|nr:helix-turn-helix domain-containing protein [Paenibacillus antri]TLS48233.1 response regulator [Paenibacillus antri]